MTNTTNNLKRPVPIGYVARKLGVTVKWLRAQAEAGQLPCLKTDKTYLFDFETVERILLERAKKGVVKMRTNNQPRPELYTTSELAQLLKIGRTKLYELRAAGKLPRPIRLGRTLRWRASDVHKWLDLDCPAVEKFEKIMKGL